MDMNLDLYYETWSKQEVVEDDQYGFFEPDEAYWALFRYNNYLMKKEWDA